MRRIGLLLFFFFISAIILNAQTLKGVLVDATDNKPLVGASLKLSSLKNSNSIFNSISDSKGAFEFNNIPADSFQLTVSYIGYEDFKQIIGVRDTIIDLGIVSVPKTSKELGEVVVTAKIPPVQQKGDTVQFNANQFKVNKDATVEDLIKKMPGVTVDRQGNVTTQGEQVRKVTVDGRDFFGDDATTALRNLPAEVIDKIQVFDRLSEQAQFTGIDDGNAIKAINIITKADMRNGQFGRIYAGYGTDDKYAAGGNMTFFNGARRISVVGQSNNINQQNFASQDLLGVTSNPRMGGNRGGGGGFRGGGGGGFRGGWGGGQGNFLIGQQSGISKTNALGINFSDVWSKKIEVSGSYFFNQNKNANNELINREYFGDTAQFYTENSFSNSTNYNHRFNMRLEYKIDSFNSIIFTPRMNFQKRNSISDLSSELSNPFELISQANSIDRISSFGYNIDNELLWRHSFRKRGRSISFEIETEFNKNDGETYTEAVNRNFANGNSFVDSLQQFSDQLSNGYRVELNLAYTEPIGKKGQLQINYRPSFSKNKADQQIFHYDYSQGKYSIFDDSLSNKLDNTYNVQNGGVTYRVGERDNQISFGLNFEHSVLEGEQTFPHLANVHHTFTNVLPNLRIQKKISPKSSIRVFYRTRTNAPSVTQLQDVVDVESLMFPTSGNPNLKQDYSHTFVTRYTYTNTGKGISFFANLFLQNTQDYITNASYLITQDSVISGSVVLRKGARLTKPVNLDGYWSARSFFTFGIPVKFIKSNLNLNSGITYTKTPGLIDNKENISDAVGINLGAVIASNINEYIDFAISYSASFNNVKNTIQPELNDKYFSHNAGLQLNLITKSGWLLQNDITNQLYKGLAEGFNQDYWLWNMSIGKKFLKDQKGELRLSVFDLLKQNQAITRNTTETYIEDVQNQVLQQYFMATFSYKLRNFGKAATNNRGNNNFRPNF